jgi:hypothetical protein
MSPKHGGRCNRGCSDLRENCPKRAAIGSRLGPNENRNMDGAQSSASSGSISRTALGDFAADAGFLKALWKVGRF